MRTPGRSSAIRLAVLAVVTVLAGGGTFYLRSGIAGVLNQEAFFRYAARHLTESQKLEFYSKLAAASPASVWETVPEPLVGRVLQFNATKRDLGADLVSNSAGMRSRTPYGPKPAGTFRIVCLGDSMVMGTAGREEDRWGDQIQEILGELHVRIGGKQVEVYSLGVGGWSAINASSYLAHRVSSYDPDLVLVMMVDNDLNDVGGVLGIGQATYRFTSEHRDDGSAVFVDHWPLEFGVADRNLLSSNLGSESRARWRAAFDGWKRLESLVADRGGRMVFGLLKPSELFLELVKTHFAAAEMRSPFIVTEYFGERLPHDGHPNRAGHRILAAHYLHVLAELGWIPVDRSRLPPLHAGLSMETKHAANSGRVATLQADLARTILRERLAFNQLTAADVRAILGGVYPGSEDQPLASYPFATVKSVFLLRRVPAARRVSVEVEVPDYPELYPFALNMLLDGKPAAVLTLQSRHDAGRHVLTGETPSAEGPALEIMLRTDAYWTSVSDFTMRSFRIISARQE
jgi:lysophospholipase L1-like esterase